jgi:ankyrin repeat protein
MQDNLGNTVLMQAIANLSEGSAKINLVKDIIKADADFSVQNKEGNNPIILLSRLGNAEALGMLIMKMLNDELNRKLIGSSLLTTDAIMKMKNNDNEDALMAAIKSKSKECINILIDIANMPITKEHLFQAKELINDNSKVYSLLKRKYHDQDGNTIANIFRQPEAWQ